MDNQHRMISGYRELSEVDVDLMNAIKAFGPQLEALVTRLQDADTDRRWISIGATSLQQGLMALTRAVTKPTFF